MKILKTTFILALIAMFSQQLCAQTYQWRGPNRDGKYNETGLPAQWPATGLPILWATEILGDGYAAPVVTANKLFVNGVENGNSTLLAFDLKGKILWKSPNGKEFTGEGYSANFPGARSTPTVVGDLVYTSSGLGRMACFDAATGKEKWAVDMVKDLKGYLNEFGYSESFVTDEKLLYCFPGGKENNITAIDRFTGKTVWTAKALGDTTHFCSPVLINLAARQIYITVSRHWLFAVDCKNGELLWKYPVAYKYDGDHVNTPVYQAPFMYWVSGDENGSGTVKLELSPDGKSVKEIWKNPSVRNSMGGIILHDNKLFVTTENKNLNIIDTNSGQVISKTKAPYGGLIFADSKFIVYGNNGDLSQFKYENGKLTPGGTFKINKGTKEHFAHPVIAGGVLYIRHGKALVACKVK